MNTNNNFSFADALMSALTDVAEAINESSTTKTVKDTVKKTTDTAKNAVKVVVKKTDEFVNKADTNDFAYGTKFSDLIAVNPATGKYRVIVKNPNVIVFWKDGTVTRVRCSAKDNFDIEKGLAMAILKKVDGNDSSRYYRTMEKIIANAETVDVVPTVRKKAAAEVEVAPVAKTTTKATTKKTTTKTSAKKTSSKSKTTKASTDKADK
jgi:hypothetical protein